jgi:hypothetical protein
VKKKSAEKHEAHDEQPGKGPSIGLVEISDDAALSRHGAMLP